MKRDMDLVRLILLEVEQHADGRSQLQLDIPGYPPEIVTYHIRLLNEAELIRAVLALSIAHPIDLTWKGHEFLNNVRSDTIWMKVKDLVGDKLGTVSLAVVQEVATSAARGSLGLG